MYTRSEIIRNQSSFSYEIKKWLERDFNNTKNELFQIKTDDYLIVEEQKKLKEKIKKVNPSKDIKRLFISETNIYPKFYAWWNEEEEKVEIFLYEAR